MKRLALISSYCDTLEKLDVLRKNVDLLHSFGIDVLVSSPIPLPLYMTKKFDHYFQTKENPVLTWPVKAIGGWITVESHGSFFTLRTTLPDHGWAGLFQTKLLSEIGGLMSYDRFYHMIYDLKIDSTVREGLDSSPEAMIYPSRNSSGTVWPAGLHFMIFDRTNLLEFAKFITLNDYLFDLTDDAFSWLLKLRDRFHYEFGPSQVEDTVNCLGSVNLYDYSTIPGLKVFVEKNVIANENLRLLFYEYSHGKNLDLSLGDGLTVNLDLEKDYLVDLGLKELGKNRLKIRYNNLEMDLTDRVNSIKYNLIEING